MKIKDIHFNKKFYWKGKKYKIFLRPKFKQAGKSIAVCYEIPCGEYIDMPLGRQVKPIIKIKEGKEC